MGISCPFMNVLLPSSWSKPIRGCACWGWSTSKSKLILWVCDGTNSVVDDKMSTKTSRRVVVSGMLDSPKFEVRAKTWNGYWFKWELSDVYMCYLGLDQWFPTDAPGTTSAPSAVLNCSPQIFEIHNMLCSKMKFDSRYGGFSDNVIIRCSTTFKRLRNTKLD